MLGGGPPSGGMREENFEIRNVGSSRFVSLDRFSARRKARTRNSGSRATRGKIEEIQKVPETKEGTQDHAPEEQQGQGQIAPQGGSVNGRCGGQFGVK